MKNLMNIILMMLVMVSSLLANNKPLPNTTLQVNAPSGLKLRIASNLQAEVLKIMPHGSIVTLKEFEELQTVDRIEWVDGNWVKVDFQGTQGWVFDGFLTSFEIPSHELEMVYEDLDFIYPVEFWAKSNFYANKIDTVEQIGNMTKTSYHFIKGHEMIVKEYETYSELKLILDDTRVMEVYNLLQAMIEPKDALDQFKESSIFIERSGTVNLIKINMDNPIQIRQLSDGRVKLVIQSVYPGC